MFYIDTHAHIENLMEAQEIITRAENKNVKKIILAGTNIKDNYANIEIAKKYPQNISVCVGFHPEECMKICEKDFKELETLIIENREYIVGIGEIGLDYYYTNQNKDKQKEVFIKQILLAKKYSLPIVIHSRNAINDILSIIKNYPEVNGVFHCFSGSYEIAKQLILMKYKIGVGGVITFKNSKLFEVINKIELSNIVLETDSPYLSPEPVRGIKNEPANIVYIAKYLEKLYNIETNVFMKAVYQNTMRLFDLK